MLSKVCLTGSVLLVLLAGCSAVQTTSEQSAKRDADTAPEQMTRPANVSYQSVTALPWRAADHRLSYGPSELQYGELWLPDSANADSPAPLVIFVHGGCWLNAYDIQHSYALSTALAEAGFVVWSLEYRRSGDEGGGWPGSLEDVIAGISYSRQLQDFPVNLNAVVLTGHSAGGHLVLLAAQRHGLPPVQAVIGLAAITNIEQYAQGSNGCQKAAAGFMGGSPEKLQAAYQQAGIRADKLLPAVHLLHGAQDSIVPQTQSNGFEHSILPSAGHFDWLHPKTSAYEVFIHKLHRFFRGQAQ